MQVSVESTSTLERKLTVGIPADKVDGAVQEKLKNTAKNIRLDGFRPGKVPVREVKRRYGDAIRQEVLGELIQNSFFEAIQQEKLNPAGMPAIEQTKNESGTDVEFVATFEVYPSIEVAGLDSIVVTKPVAEIQDADVDEMIENLRQQRKQYEDKEGAAAEGDQVVIDFEGTLEGEVFEGGSAADQTLELGSKSMIPGFEDGLIGVSAGEERTLSLTFPEDYHAEELKGKPVEFKVTVKAVKEAKVPEIDEEFIKGFGVEDGDMAKFKENVRTNMERELQNAVKGKIKNQVMDGVLAQNDVEVPKALIDQEIKNQRQQLLQQFGMAAQNMDMSMLPRDLFEEKATKSVKLGLILAELINQENIAVDGERVRAFIEDMASTYEQPEEVVNWYYSNEQQLKQIENLVLEDQVVDKILESATVNEETCSYKDAVAQDQPEEVEEEVE